MTEPVFIDPLATYDALGRKQLKRMGGFIETLRALPWLWWLFTNTVPDEFFILDGNAVQISCPCKTEPPPRVPFNEIVRCDGDGCDRWFFWDGQIVRVAREGEFEAIAAERQTAVVD